MIQMGTTYGLVDAGTGTDYVGASSQLPARDVEHALQLRPVSDVGPLEDGFGGGLRGVGVGGDELLGFGPEG